MCQRGFGIGLKVSFIITISPLNLQNKNRSTADLQSSDKNLRDGGMKPHRNGRCEEAVLPVTSPYTFMLPQNLPRQKQIPKEK